jgi:GT2 family glycosyltransferase/SAM-dependent methyltransferase
LNSTCAVIVTYQPDNARLAHVLSVLRGSIEAVVIVDNASAHLDEGRLREAYPSLILKRMETNKGIATAQNQGVALARGTHCRYVLFLDQDSLPQEGMVFHLRAALERLEAAGERVACVGPRIRLPGSPRLATFGKLGWLGLRWVPCPDETDAAVECDLILSSGTLVPFDVLDKVGGMEDAFFIDQVDTEWCLRARSMGYRIFGACDAVLEHRLGEEYLRIWFGRWRQLPRHRAFRYYYIFRNSLSLFGRNYVPAKWIWFQVRWLVALFLRYGVLGPNGEMRMMLKGSIHAMRRITGKLEDVTTAEDALPPEVTSLTTVPRPTCRLCGTVGEPLYSDLRDRLFSAPGTWHLRRCSNARCGLVWLDPQAVEEDVGLLYRSYYTHSALGSRGGVARQVLRGAFRWTWAALLSPTRISKERKRFEKLFVDDLRPGDLLEVGCGAGTRLANFAALGWRVTGQDVDAAALAEAQRTSGVEIHAGPLEDLARQGRRFDAIVMNHVIEHVVDPVRFLRTCLQMLRPGGTLICVTPNASSWGHRAFGVDWMALDPPRHLTLFTLSSLQTAAKLAGHPDPQVYTSCANAQAFAVGSFEIASTGRYAMGRRPAWRSQLLSMLAQFRALNAFRGNPESGDELILRCCVKA